MTDGHDKMLETPSPIPPAKYRTRLPPMSFSAKLVAALALLAVLASVQGAVNLWIANTAEQRVQRGRVAADIHAGFLDLAWQKDQLRAWTLQVLLGAVPPTGEGGRLSAGLIERLDRLGELARRAEAMDAARGGDGVEHAGRKDAIAVLSPALLRLREAVSRLDAVGPTADPLRAWTSLERVFDVGDGRRLMVLLQESLDRETQALATKRVAADASFAWIRSVAVAATTTIVLFAAVLAFALARGLRRPLAAVARGAHELQEGRLDHRMPTGAADEFGRIAGAFNAMAAELETRRDEELDVRRRLEDEVAARTRNLDDALADLRESEARRRRLVAEISHELRTPTTAIRGEAEIALRGGMKDAAAYRDTLERIIEASGHLSSVIDDLMTAARSDLDALTLSPEAIDFRAVVASAVVQARPSADFRGVRVLLAPSDLPLLLTGDPHRLRQMAGILLDNAIRYSHPGGVVTVAVARADAGKVLLLEIADEGIGIPENELGLVFDSQFRGAQARRHRPDGAGLGLTIARDLARRHGGDIAVASSAAGTCVVASLPTIPLGKSEEAG